MTISRQGEPLQVRAPGPTNEGPSGSSGRVVHEGSAEDIRNEPALECACLGDFDWIADFWRANRPAAATAELPWEARLVTLMAGTGGHPGIFNSTDRACRDMVSIKPKTVVTMNLQGTCASHSRTDVAVRDRQVTIDEPEVRGGTNQGPAPTETMLAALIGCTNVITHKIAAKNGVRIDALAVNVEAAFDRRGVTLVEEVAVTFPEITMRIDITTDAGEAAIETLKADLAKFCPVSKVIRQSGSKLNEVWTIIRP